MDEMKIQGRPVHGGLSVSELESLGLADRDVLDFSASINPLGTSPAALEAVAHENLAAYPDPHCTELTRAIGEETGVDPEQIVAGNGSTELIHLLARAFLKFGDSAAIFSPTFGEYSAACQLQGVTPLMIRPNRGEFDWDVEQAAQTIADVCPKLVFLCNPNNPTGVYLSEREVGSIAETLNGTGLLVLDEAYVPFVDCKWDSLPLLEMGNVALLRSMTKDYALTGLRLGYLMSSQQVVNRVARYQYSWSVNALAQAAGIAALDDPEHVLRGRDVVRQGKAFLAEVVTEAGVECLSGAANFLLMRVGDAEAVRRELLLSHLVCVRDCASFGLPEFIRVGVRTMNDNRALADALREVLASCK